MGAFVEPTTGADELVVAKFGGTTILGSGGGT